MSKTHATNAANKYEVAALSFELGTAAAGKVQLTPAGEFRSVDGRPAKGSWRMTAALAAKLSERFAARATDIVVDYEHQTLHKEANGQPAPAAGWFKRVSFEEGVGLFAADLSWTPQAKQQIADSQYRYISPVLIFDATSGDVVGLHSVALTNTPALDGLAPLVERVALSLNTNPDFSTALDGGTMTPEQIAALTKAHEVLTAKAETDKTAIAALTTERDALKTESEAQKTQVAALTKELGDIKAKVEADKATAETKERDAMLAEALSKGVLAPAQKEWAGKQSLSALAEYLQAASPFFDAKRQAGKTDDAGHGLSQEEIAMCSRMDVTPEAFKAAKAV